MRKPELLATAGSLEELERVVRAGADAVEIGEARWGLRLAGSFPPADLREAVAIARGFGAKVYVAVNGLMDNRLAEELPGYLKELERLQVDAVVFGDPAVPEAVREYAIRLRLHWGGEMTAVNSAAARFWAERGASRVLAARELNLEELHAFRRNIGIELQVQVHGATNIYHSRRKLVRSYLEHLGIGGADTGRDAGLFLTERERPGLRLPIYEDEHGTHIMSPDDICLLEVLDELLREPIDSLKVEGLLKSPDYNETAVRSYRAAIDAWCTDPAGYRFNPEWLEAIRALQDPGRELTYGFLFKEQVY